MRVSAMDEANTLVVLAHDSVFTCRGNITEWRLRWYHSRDASECGSIRFIFSVFRQSSECGSLQLVGSNVYDVEVDDNNILGVQEVENVFLVEEEKIITVDKGDFISVIVTLSSSCETVETSVWVAGRRGVEAKTYHKVYNTLFGALLLSTLIPCNLLFQQNNTIFPFISAVVGEYTI